MMFEVEDLNHASPATVSRCGMIYFSESTIGPIALYKSWRSKTRISFEYMLNRLDALIEENFSVLCFLNYLIIKFKTKNKSGS